MTVGKMGGVLAVTVGFGGGFGPGVVAGGGTGVVFGGSGCGAAIVGVAVVMGSLVGVGDAMVGAAGGGVVEAC